MKNVQLCTNYIFTSTDNNVTTLAAPCHSDHILESIVILPASSVHTYDAPCLSLNSFIAKAECNLAVQMATKKSAGDYLRHVAQGFIQLRYSAED